MLEIAVQRSSTFIIYKLLAHNKLNIKIVSVGLYWGFLLILVVRNDLRNTHKNRVPSNSIKIMAVFHQKFFFCASLKVTLFQLAGLIKLRELVRFPGNRDVEVHLRQADPESYRSVLKEIKSKEIHNMVVDTRPEHMHHFLRGVSTTLHLLSNIL